MYSRQCSSVVSAVGCSDSSWYHPSVYFGNLCNGPSPISRSTGRSLVRQSCVASRNMCAVLLPDLALLNTSAVLFSSDMYLYHICSHAVRQFLGVVKLSPYTNIFFG